MHQVFLPRAFLHDKEVVYHGAQKAQHNQVAKHVYNVFAYIPLHRVHGMRKKPGQDNYAYKQRNKGYQPEDGVFAKRKLVGVMVVGVEERHEQHHIHARAGNEEQILALVIQKEWKW
jgi:hypothetical protein